VVGATIVAAIGPSPATAVAAAVFVTVFRLLALWRGWHAPGARNNVSR
jgi:hypothetical protein